MSLKMTDMYVLCAYEKKKKIIQPATEELSMMLQNKGENKVNRNQGAEHKGNRAQEELVQRSHR